jgi:membrane-bound serine protease (ClpP class)
VVVPIHGTIDLATVLLVSRAIDKAERDAAAAVILEIDTFGGRVDAAVAIRDRLLASRTRTVAFVNPRAISAGALIALACEKIVMQDGGTIGAATPIAVQPGGATAAVDEKTTSYVRKEFRATAERRGRSGILAEAMVDPSVAVPLAPDGKLLTLTTDEAITEGMADLRANDRAAVLEFIGMAGAEERESAHTWAEHVVRIVTHPIVASLLISLGMLGFLIEIRTPGFGVPGLVGIACFVLFFGGHYIAALAGYEEILLAVLGVILIATEIFVVPGFGIVGVLGISALLLSLGLSIIGAGATPNALLAMLGRVGISLVLALAAFFATLSLLPASMLARGLILGKSLESAGERDGIIGAFGTTLTPLRPSGIATFDDARIDVVSEGRFLPAGTRVQLVRREGHRVVVRPEIETATATRGGP